MTSRGTQPLTLCTYESETILIDGEYRECFKNIKRDVPSSWIGSEDDSSFMCYRLTFHEAHNQVEGFDVNANYISECLQAAKDLWIASVVDTKKIVGYVMNDDDTPYCRHVYLITTHRKTQAILTRIKCCLHEYYLPKKDKCISSYRYTTVQEE
jgi:hypothetical protein